MALAAWVVVDESLDARCTRCGGRVPAPPMPITVDAFAKWAAYAVELHKDC